MEGPPKRRCDCAKVGSKVVTVDRDNAVMGPSGKTNAMQAKLGWHAGAGAVSSPELPAISIEVSG